MHSAIRLVIFGTLIGRLNVCKNSFRITARSAEDVVFWEKQEKRFEAWQTNGAIALGGVWDRSYILSTLHGQAHSGAKLGRLVARTGGLGLAWRMGCGEEGSTG